MSDAVPASTIEGLDGEQLVAVTSNAMPLCLLASAGSGKTRVLTRRVARRVLDGSCEPSHTLVLTFTRKAATELRERLHRLGVDEDIVTGTFHAIAYGELRRRHLDAGRTAPVVTSQPARILERVIDRLQLGHRSLAKVIATEISWAKGQLVDPGSYETAARRLHRRPPISGSLLARIYEAYENEKKKRAVVDYDDLLLMLTEALRSDKAFAAVQRWRFRHFFVDEFQDLNAAQFNLLRAWLGGRQDLFVVGDPNQAIYGWNGADAGYLLDISRYFPDVEILELHSNYRSTDAVLTAAKAILPSAGKVRCNYESPAGFRAPEISGHVDEQDEARSIARRLRLAQNAGRRWSDLAVLTRTNAQRAPIEAALTAARVPYRSAGGASWLYATSVKEVLDFLREHQADQLRSRLRDIEELVQEQSEDGSNYLLNLVAGCHECLASDPEIRVREFLSWIEIASTHDGPTGSGADSGAVTVTTFHRAKGLEWPVVFLAGVEEGLVPFGNPNTKQLEEEQRLFYVAITRAREDLHLTWASRRGAARTAEPRRPSSWLASISDAFTDAPVSATGASAGSHISEGRAVLHLTSQPVDGLRQAIERWRAARAKLTGIDARLILADDVLGEIVRRQPRDTEQLGAIAGFGAVRAAAEGGEIIALVKTNQVEVKRI